VKRLWRSGHGDAQRVNERLTHPAVEVRRIGGGWECRNCGTINVEFASVCENCRRPASATPDFAGARRLAREEAKQGLLLIAGGVILTAIAFAMSNSGGGCVIFVGAKAAGVIGLWRAVVAWAKIKSGRPF
jgi:hypothetical protein